MRRTRRLLAPAAASFLFGAGALGVFQAGKPKPVDAGLEVLPLLKGRCGSCHGPQSPTGLNLTTLGGLEKGGASGPVVVARDPSKSILVRRLRGLDGKPQMPMGFAPLDEPQIKLIERWIEEGASFESKEGVHWAYKPPVRPPIPQVKQLAWVRNPIDAFVLARLEKEGLKPSPEASKETLIRRVTLDLIGLPPTLREIDDFLTDKSPNAYEKVVDRLLKSPHYGERQARIWLDLARYADTNGFEADYSRVMWKWRDWVIDAYNRNLPFDRFTVEQLAGDMLPNATIENRIASGFHRNAMFNSEGGVDKDEQYFEVLIDRVATTGLVWQAQTYGCARCHDHKYDPITQKDFYRLYAVWNNSAYKVEGDHNVGQDKNIEPIIEAPSPEQAKEKERLTRELDALSAKLKEAQTAAEANWQEWLKEARSADWFLSSEPSIKASSGVPVHISDDRSVILGGKAPAHETISFEATLPSGEWHGVRLDALPDPSFPRNGPGRASSGNFILSRIEVENAEFKEFEASFIQEGYGTAGLLDQNGDTGWAVYPKPGTRHVLIGAFKQPLVLKEPTKVSLKLIYNSPTWPEHVIGKFKLFFTRTKSPMRFAYSDDVHAAITAYARDPNTDPKPLRAFAARMDPAVRAARAEYEAKRAELRTLQAKIPTALVLQEKPNGAPLKANLHIRGEWLSKGPEVEAGTPEFLPKPPADRIIDRLAVAEWLVSPENPLTARVQVNRMWEGYFGRGIVETSDNFGTQGSRPSHPELLDWLATEVVRRGWDMRAMHRLIVTSATYRQSSNATPSLLQKDPNNELLARGPRIRMEAETIRDNALAIAGLLDLKVGGPSVFPRQPEGVWNSPYSGERWMTSQGGDLHRRGLYTFWKRTAPYPSFMNFDATSREQCAPRRTRTNTPLQALTLLNDEAFLDAAKGLGERMLKEGGKTASERIVYGFRLATARKPSKAELGRLLELARSLEAKYKKDPDKAKKLAGGVQEAVYALLASTILNLDETITKS